MDQSKEVLVESEQLPEHEDHDHHHEQRRSTVNEPPIKRLRLKKFLSYGVISMFLFLTGVQYVLILPTAYDYVVIKYGGDSNFYGFVLAAYSFSALFANLLFGWLSDGIISVRVSATICNVFLLIGSIMYFIGINKWFLMLSRLISGIGTGAGTSYWADLARNTPENEKTKIFSIVMLFRQLGIVVGPAFNLLLRRANFMIGPFPVNADSIPGLFMAVVWIIMIFFCFFCYTDLEKFIVKKKSKRGSIAPQVNTATDSIAEIAKSEADLESTPIIKKAEKKPRLVGEGAPPSVRSSVSDTKPTMRDYVYALAKEDVLCLQFVLFVSGFVQTALEAMLPPMSYIYIEWGENQTSLWFLISGLVTIFIFVLVSGPLSRLFHDYWLTMFGVFLELFSFPFLIVMAYICTTCCDHYLGRLAPNDPYALGLLLGGFGVNTLGLPFIAACTVSLFSNAVPERYQGMAHGIRRSLSFLGYLLGPIWGGAYMPYLAINFIALLGMYFLSFFMLLASKGSLFR